MYPFQKGSAKFVDFTKALNINLVDCSPTLQKVQYDTLKCEDELVDDGKRTVSKLCGAPVCWHASLEQVPSGCMGLFSFWNFMFLNY
jgi:NADH dehydrogenase [ubiquinone] 1 alpha subcomplex assembly factor 7